MNAKIPQVCSTVLQAYFKAVQIAVEVVIVMQSFGMSQRRESDTQLCSF